MHYEPKVKPTPGPWYVGVKNDCYFILNKPPRPSNDDIVDIADVEVVAKIGASKIDGANACLIAAAPCILKALLPFADIGVGTNEDYEPYIRLPRQDIINARAAIRKANG